ncbi:MAG: ribbon-helix-helix domain-containing protein [Candidatus Diapherotrites archaeon]
MKNRRGKLGVFEVEKAPAEDLPQKEKRTDRAGRTAMPFWVPLAARKQLRVMAAEMDTTQQELMRIALNDLFKKHGKPPIA